MKISPLIVLVICLIGCLDQIQKMKFCHLKYYTEADSYELTVEKIEFQGSFTTVNDSVIFVGNKNLEPLYFKVGDVVYKSAHDSIIHYVRSDSIYLISNYGHEQNDAYMKWLCD